MRNGNVVEFRGIRNLFAAEVIEDSLLKYEVGTPFSVAALAEISKTVETSSSVKYYDNKAALSLASEGATTLTITTDALGLDMVAKLTGKEYDEENKVLLDKSVIGTKYFAIGYAVGMTDGTERFVWLYKCSFAYPEESSKTADAGTDSTGQTLTCTAIETTHQFDYQMGEVAKKSSFKGLVAETGPKTEGWFDAVQTPDKIYPVTGED